MRRPATERLELSDGDYLIVKQDLTAGEYRELMRASIKPVTAAVTPARRRRPFELDPVAAGVAMVVAYLLDWSFADADGRADRDRRSAAAPSSSAALDHIDADAYMEVQSAIQAHQSARARRRSPRKKNTPWRARTRQDLDVCRVMGWTWDDLQDVPQPIYDELIAYLVDEQTAHRAPAVTDAVKREFRRGFFVVHRPDERSRHGDAGLQADRRGARARRRPRPRGRRSRHTNRSGARRASSRIDTVAASKTFIDAYAEEQDAVTAPDDRARGERQGDAGGHRRSMPRWRRNFRARRNMPTRRSSAPRRC